MSFCKKNHYKCFGQWQKIIIIFELVESRDSSQNSRIQGTRVHLEFAHDKKVGSQSEI